MPFNLGATLLSCDERNFSPRFLCGKGERENKGCGGDGKGEGGEDGGGGGGCVG